MRKNIFVNNQYRQEKSVAWQHFRDKAERHIIHENFIPIPFTFQIIFITGKIIPNMHNDQPYFNVKYVHALSTKMQRKLNHPLATISMMYM